MKVSGLNLQLEGLQQGDPLAPGYYQIGSQKYYYDGTHFWLTVGGQSVQAFFNRQTAPSQLSISPGNNLKIALGFSYTGPAVSNAQAYFGWGYFGALGNWAPTQEIWVTFQIPANQSSTPVQVQQSHTFTLPASGLATGLADILVQVNGGTPDVGQHDLAYNQALNIIGVTPSITNFTILSFAKA